MKNIFIKILSISFCIFNIAAASPISGLSEEEQMAIAMALSVETVVPCNAGPNRSNTYGQHTHGAVFNPPEDASLDEALARSLAEYEKQHRLEQEDQDAMLAATLYAEEESKLRHYLKTEDTYANDLAIIQALTEGFDLSAAKGRTVFPMPEALQAAYHTYTSRWQALGNPMDMDVHVHAFNKQMGFGGLISTLQQYDTFTDPGLSFAAVKNAILAASFFQNSIDEALRNDVKAGLATLASHITRSEIETVETNCNVPQLLSRIYSLSAQDKTVFQSLLMTLGDNRATGGGCYPGHAGRLADLYIKLLRGFWQE